MDTYLLCVTLPMNGGTIDNTIGSNYGKGSGLPSGGTTMNNIGIIPTPPSDGSTSDGSDGSGREPEDPVDPVGGDPCCNVGGGATLDSGKVIVSESIVITTEPISGSGGLCSQTTVTTSTTYSDGTTVYSPRTMSINCVSFDESGTIKTSANTAGDCPECIPPADGTIGILPPKGSTTEVESEEEQIVNNLTGKADCVYQKLLNSGTGFASAIKKFDGEFPVAHLIYSMDRNLPDTINAVTNNSAMNFIEIRINEKTLPIRTILGLARTFAHETIHAELFRKVRSVGGNVSIDDFPGIYDYYRRFVKNWQHEQMAAHYRSVIVSILKEFDKNQHSEQLYNDLAWEGLLNTTSWNNLSIEERNRIVDSIINFRNTANKKCIF